MKSTSALLIRSLISKLHPPTPLTARESQHLLRTLDGAFRKRLDEAHPAPNLPRQLEEIDGPTDSSRSASAYLDSVLHHPLLESELAAKSPTIASAHNISAVARFERVLRDGTLTMTSLNDCARQYATERHRHGPAMKGRMAPKLAAWFDSANPQTQAEFFCTPATADAVIHALYTDHAHNTVWTWLRVLYQRSWGATAAERATWLVAEDRFVSRMMNWSIANREPIAAAQQFIAATKHRITSVRAPPPSATSHASMKYSPLRESWARLASYILKTRNQHALPEATFDTLLKYIPPKGPHMHLSSDFMRVYHPGSPSAEALHRDLQNPERATQFAVWKSKKTPRLQRVLSVAILDAAELSLKQGRSLEATFFLEFAQTHFPEIISKPDTLVNPVSQLDRARAEVGATGTGSAWLAPRFGGASPAFG